jgi:hypothetical protein
VVRYLIVPPQSDPKHHRGPQNEAQRRQAESINRRLRELPKELRVAVLAHSTHHDWDYTSSAVAEQVSWSLEHATQYVEQHKTEIELLARGPDDVLGPFDE